MNKGRTILYFSLGIIAGGAIVSILLNQFYKAEDVVEKKKEKTEKNNEKDSSIGFSVEVKDSLGNYLDKKLPIKIAGEPDDVYENIDNNSSTYDSLMEIREASTDHVNRDQLIAKQKVNLKKMQKTDNSDSLVNKLNHVKSNAFSKVMEVEIWASPINYKGYQLSKSKLVVFGISPDDEKMLFELNDYVILQSGNKYYQLIKTSDFKPLKLFKDESVLSLIRE